MPHLRFRAMLALSALLAAGAAESGPDDLFLKTAFGERAAPGASLCLARSYDDAHLATHKGQRLRDVAIEFTVRRTSERRFVEWGLSAHFVGSKQLYWSGGECDRYDGLVAHCYVEGDGGTFDLTLAADGKSGTARFDTLRIWRPQDAADESEVTLDRSSADKVARLDKAPKAACARAGK
jgi:hypothetical protein